MNKMVVRIANKDYTIIGEEDVNYIERVASYVDNQIKKANEMSKSSENLSATVLAAINIADQYFKEMEKNIELLKYKHQISLNLDGENTANEVKENEARVKNDKQELNSDIVKELEEENKRLKEENDKLNKLLNDFQNDIYNLQLELTKDEE